MAQITSVSDRCNLNLWEKYFIICRPELATLNKRNEVVTSCRHTNKFLLKDFTHHRRALGTVKIRTPRANKC